MYELHKDCTMRGVLPVHQGKNGENYWYIPCIKFILFINTYVNTNTYKYYVIVDTKFVSLIRGALKKRFFSFRDFVLTSLCTEQQLYIHSNTPSLSSNSKLKQIKYCFHQGACANRLCTEQQKQHLLGILQVQKPLLDATCLFLFLPLSWIINIEIAHNNDKMIKKTMVKKFTTSKHFPRWICQILVIYLHAK